MIAMFLLIDFDHLFVHAYTVLFLQRCFPRVDQIHSESANYQEDSPSWKIYLFIIIYRTLFSVTHQL